METYVLQAHVRGGRDCLNRTMQYGNDFDVKAKGLRLTSLNRTMQYGNNR